MKRFISKLRSKGNAFLKAGWIVEANPAGDGLHLHGVLRDLDHIEPATLEECAVIAGFGPVAKVRALPTGPTALANAARRSSAKYLVKSVVYEPLGTEAAHRGALSHLSLNAGRATHPFRPGTFPRALERR